jgi:hypothetical protein
MQRPQFRRKRLAPLHPDTHPGRLRRRCACTVRGGGACEHTRTSGIICAALAGMLHGRALTGTGTSVVPGIATRSLPHAATPRHGSVRVQGSRAALFASRGGDDETTGARMQRRGVIDSKTARGRGRARARPTSVHRPPTGSRSPSLSWHRETLNNFCSLTRHVPQKKNLCQNHLRNKTITSYDLGSSRSTMLFSQLVSCGAGAHGAGWSGPCDSAHRASERARARAWKAG